MIISTPSPPLDVDLALVDRTVVEGKEVSATLRLAARSPVEVRGGQVRLAMKLTYFHKEGGLYAGRALARARRTEVRAAVPIAGPWPLEPGEEVALPLSLPVPVGSPGTTKLSAVEITWTLAVTLQVVGFADVAVEQPLTVLSGADACRHVATGPPVVVERRCAALAFAELSTRSVDPGSTLSGVLAVTPLRRCAARGIRVELLVRQAIHHGEWIGEDPTRNPAYQELERDDVIARCPLTGDLALEHDQPLRLPFVLALPAALPAASLDTSHFTLTWMLRALVDRPLWPNPSCELALHARTTRG